MNTIPPTRAWCRVPFAGFVAIAMLTVGCARPKPWSVAVAPSKPTDEKALEHAPAKRDPSLIWDAVNQSSFGLMRSSLDLPRQYRKLIGDLKQAQNATTFGEAPNSSWFTNRHGWQRMSAQELQRGPNVSGGPDTSGTWLITRAKTEGVTPGFFVKDASGTTFVVKFDPLDHPELATGAEMVCTKFFHAIGYNVPENYLVHFDPGDLRIKEGLEFEDMFGKEHSFTREHLDDLLARVAKSPDGRIRAIASRFLPGKPLGPFSYKGRRDDDPNDIVSHQHRLELRGLKVFAQLVNHFDTKDHNTLDILMDEDGKRYIRHYLIDFGSTLGSDGDEPKAVYKGYAYVLDLEQALVSLVTLGLRRWSWEGASAEGTPPAVGYFESERFDPPGWKPLHRNPAFDNMTHSDAFWAARIVAAFTEDDFRVLVEAAEYSDPAASAYLVRTLMERRRKIIDYYYGKLNPLAGFALAATDDGLTLSFVDRWVTDDVGPGNARAHRYRFGQRRGQWGSYRTLSGDGPIVFDGETLGRIRREAETADELDDRVFNVQIQSSVNGNWGPWVRVYLYCPGELARARLIGVERET